MTGADISKAGGIYFEKITEGFERYRHKILKLNQRQAYVYLRGLWELSRGAAFMDFYYQQLNDQVRERIGSALLKEEYDYLEQYRRRADSLFVPLEEQLLKIHLKMNEEQMLFSSFYFTGLPCTVWANYNQEYVVFKLKDI